VIESEAQANLQSCSILFELFVGQAVPVASRCRTPIAAHAGRLQDRSRFQPFASFDRTVEDSEGLVVGSLDDLVHFFELGQPDRRRDLVHAVVNVYELRDSPENHQAVRIFVEQLFVVGDGHAAVAGGELLEFLEAEDA